jgi:4-diphosphocytidyl-2-C-methyl-D-erythritol kinase
VKTVLAHAKINLALVVGPMRADGKHEVATVLQRVALADRLALGPAESLSVEGYDGDTIVAAALRALAAAGGVEPTWRVELDKEIPIAAGLGGGSSDAAAALRVANDLLTMPLSHQQLAAVAAGVGADVPFFLQEAPQLGFGDGTDLTALDLPRDYHVVLVLPAGQKKGSTAAVYARFDDRGGDDGFEERANGLLAGLALVESAADLATLPPNDLAGSPLAGELLELGAFRADVSGAGPCVYGLFGERAEAEAAADRLAASGATWVTTPC